ncbi:FtsX-like permease family protein [Kitasatospora sp. GAS1066B]|uniref:ABC transporter permease n=1 Tax=Kitasatospora sp. GAS1066B TaxID=3156271 RepID=UPI003516C140
MIRLGLRLTLAAGREAVGRLAVIAGAVGVGVALLLSVLATINATTTQNDRNAWLNTGLGAPPATAKQAADPAWWMIKGEYFQGKQIGRVDVAVTGPDSPVPPGMSHLPGPGEYDVSPALGKLLAGTPADELGARYPGHQVGTIGNAALPGPDSLIIIIGHTPDQLADNPEAHRITAISSLSPSDCGACLVGANPDSMKLILSVSAVALIFPVLIFIGTATRLAAARREQRFAAMRLVGATPRQISAIATVESTVAAVLGTAAGFLLFFLIRPVVAGMNFTKTPFFTSDLSLTAVNVLLVVLGVPVAAAVAARLALRRVQISPLGVTRRVTPRPPRVYRVIPLAAGVAELGYFVGRRPPTTNGQIQAFVPGILLILGGLVVAGPWLTMAGARLMARRAQRPAVLVAARRLADDPRAAFRAVSGLVLALCVTTGAVGIMTAMTAERGIPKGSPTVRATVIDDFFHGQGESGHFTDPETPLPAAVLAQLRAIPGVQGVTVLHTNPLGVGDPLIDGPRAPGPMPPSALASCAQLASTPAFSTCPAGAEAASVTPFFSELGLDFIKSWPARWPAAAFPADQIDGLPVLSVVVTTDGSRAAVEQARTLLALTYPSEAVPYTIAEDRAEMTKQLSGFQQLADVVILVSLPIAGCSLAVSIVGGLTDRKRPFSLLRLTGVQLGVLRRVVLLESALPLLVVAVVAIGMGFLAAQLFLKAQLGYSLHAPDPSYYLLVLLGLAASLGVIGSTLPLLRRITGPQTARND